MDDQRDYFFFEEPFFALGIAPAGFEEGLPKFFGPFLVLFAIFYDLDYVVNVYGFRFRESEILVKYHCKITVLKN